MKGLILPAGSPLVQFELNGFPHGGKVEGDAELPLVLWVNRNPALKPCPSGAKAFFISSSGEYEASTVSRKTSTVPAVCLCMGRFVE